MGEEQLSLFSLCSIVKSSPSFWWLFGDWRLVCGGVSGLRACFGVFPSRCSTGPLLNPVQVATIKPSCKHTTRRLCNAFLFIPRQLDRSSLWPSAFTRPVPSPDVVFCLFVCLSLINTLQPGIVKRVNRLPTPIAGLVRLLLLVLVWLFFFFVLFQSVRECVRDYVRCSRTGCWQVWGEASGEVGRVCLSDSSLLVFILTNKSGERGAACQTAGNRMSAGLEAV